MAYTIDLQRVVKQMVDGTLAENLCRVCLSPLGDVFENVFTKFCNGDTEFCIADVLEDICNVKIDPSEEYRVCPACFIAAVTVYKFHFISQQTNNVINFYVEELEKNVDQIEMLQEETNGNVSLCITLPAIQVETPLLNFKAEECVAKYRIGIEPIANEGREKLINNNSKKKNVKDEKLILVVNEGANKPLYYKIKTDGTLKELSRKKDAPKSVDAPKKEKSIKKKSRKRNPMVSLQCGKCPVKYRFMAKLKEHMKLEHNLDFYVCQVCKATFEDEQEYTNHQKMHTNIHYCAYCNAVFKKRQTIITHLKAHEDLKNLSKMEGAHVCDQCGFILPDEEELKIHYDKKHHKKYTCYYCGRMYKGEYSFDMHVKKHEDQVKLKDDPQTENSAAKKYSAPKKSHDKKITPMCVDCGKSFGDERSLKWHSMLHTNERPYKCNVCGRGFISVNRRNQHALCAHSVPTRRCPLCPALFHLRSMVNTHIKKVHLRAHKRRGRTSKHQNAVWRTETVPVQELSVSIQSAILDLQTKQGDPIL